MFLDVLALVEVRRAGLVVAFLCWQHAKVTKE